MLFQENRRTLRPLEEAMFHETLQLFTAIFSTKTYLMKTKNVGMRQIDYFDVTDYEAMNSNRSRRSPLRFLSLLGKSKRYTKYVDEILQEPIKSWYAAKNAAFRPFIFAWGTFRLFYMILYFYGICTIVQTRPPKPNVNGTNSSQFPMLTSSDLNNLKVYEVDISTNQKCILILAIVLSMLIILLDIKEFVSSLFPKPYKESRFYLKRNLLAQEKFYRSVQFAVVLLTMVLCSVIINMSYGNRTNANMTYIQVNNKYLQILNYH